MKKIFFFLLLIPVIIHGQKNAPPQFYKPGFKLPSDAPVRTDGSYVESSVYYETVPMSNVKKNGYTNIERTLKTLYRFYDNGYFFYTPVNSDIKDLQAKLQNDSGWVRKLYKMKLTDAWGFYTIRNDSVVIETFQFEDHLRDIMKTFSKQYFMRSEGGYRPEGKMLINRTTPIIVGDHAKVIQLPYEFIPTPYFVDPAENKLLTFGRFRRMTGFDPK